MNINAISLKQYDCMLHLCRACVLQSLRKTVILLFNFVKNWDQLIQGNSKNDYFFTTKWQVDLFTGRLIHSENTVIVFTVLDHFE